MQTGATELVIASHTPLEPIKRAPHSPYKLRRNPFTASHLSGLLNARTEQQARVGEFQDKQSWLIRRTLKQLSAQAVLDDA